MALALMAALTVSLYASLGIAFKSRDRSAAALAPTRSAVLTMDLLRLDLESAMPPTGILAGEFLGQDGKTDAGKDADTLLFHACAHAPDGKTTASDIRRVELAFVTQPNDLPALHTSGGQASRQAGAEGALVRRITTNLLAPEVVTPREETLCRHILSFNIRYFDGTVWLDNWDSTTRDNALPSAVEVSLELACPAPAESGRTARIFLIPCGQTTTSNQSSATRG